MSDKLLKKLTSLPAAMFVFTLIVFGGSILGSLYQLRLDRFVTSGAYPLSPRLSTELIYMPSVFELLITLGTIAIILGISFVVNKFVFDRPRLFETIIVGVFTFEIGRTTASIISASMQWTGALVWLFVIAGAMYMYQRFFA